MAAGIRWGLVGSSIVLACLAAAPARAQNCAYSVSNLNFGNIDVTANTPFTASGTYSATCSALLTATRTCPNVETGSGGIHASGSPRYLASGPDRLAFNLFSDPSYSTVWGSYLWGFPFTSPATDITTILLGNGSASRTIYARIANGQQTLPAGSYVSSFAGGHTRMTRGAYLLGMFPPDCATLTTPIGQAPFTVTATIVTNCAVSATTLDFGISGVLSNSVDASNALNVTCTAQTPYTIALDLGTSGATDPTQRKMTKAAETISYGLYRDATRTLVWGITTGVNTLAATGTGLAQTHTVYGRVPAQSTPSPGTYTDTIVVTVTY